jgi:hypothetical protein
MNWNQVVAEVMRVRFWFIFIGRLQEMLPVRTMVQGEEKETRAGQ